MTLADLDLFQAVIEVRYAQACALLDKAGELWTRLALELGELRMLSAVPAETVFRLGSEYELAVKLETASIHAFKPDRTLGGFAKNADLFYRSVVELVQIPQFSRVGFRLVYSRDFPTVEEASAVALSSPILNAPQGRHFNQAGRPLKPEWALRWEDGHNGIHTRLRIDEWKYEFLPPLVWEGPASVKKETVSVA